MTSLPIITPCEPCGGLCCQSGGGFFVPGDPGLRLGLATLVDGIPAAPSGDNGTCLLWDRHTGCVMSFGDRPSQCRHLIPNGPPCDYPPVRGTDWTYGDAEFCRKYDPWNVPGFSDLRSPVFMKCFTTRIHIVE